MDVKKKKNKLREFLNRTVILLGVSITLIGGMFFFRKITGADFYIVAMAQSEGQENSLLTEQKPVELKLNKRKDTDNVAFQVSNMFPGDVVLGNYCVKVSYKETVTIGFRVDIGKGYDKLAEVLKCKIVLSDTNELLYDGLMKEVPKALEHVLSNAEKGEAELCYQISAYLDTSVDNTYQNTRLEADFVWWIEAEEETDTDTDEPTIPDSDDEGDDAGSVDEEKNTAGTDTETGDDTNMVMWLALAVCAVAGFLVLIGTQKQKEAKDNEQ